jgi:hypothetical protein
VDPFFAQLLANQRQPLPPHRFRLPLACKQIIRIIRIIRIIQSLLISTQEHEA